MHETNSQPITNQDWGFGWRGQDAIFLPGLVGSGCHILAGAGWVRMPYFGRGQDLAVLEFRPGWDKYKKREKQRGYMMIFESPKNVPYFL